MYAMQYELTLPADYDMQIIRTRVQTRGHLMDDFEGLKFKAYLIREKAEGAPANEYSPFYVWNNPAGMARFLWEGGGFQGIVRDFGRPAVRHWTGVETLDGPATTARSATKAVTPIPVGADLTEYVQEATANLTTLASDPDVYAAAMAIDPTQWHLIHFILWRTVVSGGYEVLHLSMPG